MVIDYLCTAALAEQLRREFDGAKLQSVTQIGRLRWALELYSGQRRNLILDAAPEGPGLRIRDEKVRRGSGAPAPLGLAMASRLVGLRLRSVEQPPFERILILGFGQGQAVELRLIAELMGRLGNLLLVDETDRVLALARPVTAEMSRVRTLLPGQPYQAPPAPPKSDFDAISEPELGAWLAEAGEGLAWKVLVARIKGVSPLAAREMVARAAGASGLGSAPALTAAAVDPAALLAALSDLMRLPESGDWAPSLGFAEALPAVSSATPIAAALAEAPSEATDRIVTPTAPASEASEPVSDPATPPSAYAPYLLTHLPAHRPEPSIAAAIEAFLGARENYDAYGPARAAVALVIEEASDRARRLVAALKRERVDADEIERAKLSGDLILAYQHMIRPGQASFEAPWGDETIPIPLNPAISAIANAERFYERQRRAKRAAKALPKRRAAAEARLATLEQLAADLALAEDRPAIDAVAVELSASGLLGRSLPRKMTAAAQTGRPLSLVSSDGITILVGRNSRQNEQVTFERGARGDLWLHARGFPGAHVVIKSAGREVPEQSILEAARLAAWFSRARSESKVEVIVTDLRHVSRLPGGGTGMVRFREERGLMVVPGPPESLEE